MKLSSPTDSGGAPNCWRSPNSWVDITTRRHQRVAEARRPSADQRRDQQDVGQAAPRPARRAAPAGDPPPAPVREGRRGPVPSSDSTAVTDRLLSRRPLDLTVEDRRSMASSARGGLGLHVGALGDGDAHVVQDVRRPRPRPSSRWRARSGCWRRLRPGPRRPASPPTSAEQRLRAGISPISANSALVLLAGHDLQELDGQVRGCRCWPRRRGSTRRGTTGRPPAVAAGQGEHADAWPPSPGTVLAVIWPIFQPGPISMPTSPLQKAM